MRVCCSIDRVSAISDAVLRRRLSEDVHDEGRIAGLEIGREFDVQAVEAREDGIVYFYIVASGLPWPTPYAANFFEVVDARISRGWEIRIPQGRFKRLSFSEWTHDDTFYEKLVNQEKEALEAYGRALEKEESF